MANPLLPPRALSDIRPRIHIRQQGLNYQFSYGPTGRSHHAENLGSAIENALAGTIQTGLVEGLGK